MKKVFEQKLSLTDISLEDGKQSLIVDVEKEKGKALGSTNMFVRLHSWSDNKDHTDLKQFAFPGAKVRITVELVE